MTRPDYHCPICGQMAGMVIGPTQAFCTNVEGCDIICFNPSLPDKGLSQIQFVKLDDETESK